MDKSEVFRHDIAAELSFPSLHGIPQSLGRALYKLADTPRKELEGDAETYAEV